MAEEKQKKAPKTEGSKPKGDAKAKGEKKSKGEGGYAEKQPVSNRPVPPARLHKHYKDHVIPTLMKRFNYSNVNQVPRIDKIAVNIGVGDATSDPKLLDAAVRDLEAIVGQKPAITKSRHSI